MGEVEHRLFEQTESTPYNRADHLGRQILRGGTFIKRNLYKYQGKYYTVIGGRAQACEDAAAYHREKGYA